MQERQTVCWRAFMRVRWWRERPGRQEGKLSHPFFKLSHERNACSNIQWMWTGGCLQTAKTSLSRAEKGGRRKLLWNKAIGGLSPFCVIFVIQSCGKRNKLCLSSMFHPGAAAATAETAQVLLVTDFPIRVLVINSECLMAARGNGESRVNTGLRPDSPPQEINKSVKNMCPEPHPSCKITRACSETTLVLVARVHTPN